ncbi:DUF2625 family protein [Mycobacterium sp. URHD0025]|uniref:DUF2625 family protein n=1 Tax=Mycobacterium sp. URHD0025 TaxID=1298864 RepID=UPI00040F7CE8|nr:DUF2625 family protein [Mycobacterium sp. URHD0025]
MAEQRRGLDELDLAESTVWAQIEQWAQQGTNRVLPITATEGQAQLLNLQMTTLSTQGAVTLNCGGILADHGWLKLFGGGTADMPALADLISGIEGIGGAGLCGIDVLGGVFAINWGAFPGEHHLLWYWAPDALDWEPCGDWKHVDLLYAALTGQMDKFYADLRWPGWQDDVAALAVDQGYTLTPDPYTVEGRDKSQVRKGVVPMAEICRVMQMLTRPGGLFATTSPRYPMYWTKGRHYRPDIDRFIALDDLLNVDNPLWPQLQPLIEAGAHQVVPADAEIAKRRLEYLEYGVDTGIGAMVYHCATLLVDHGWLRLYGCGTSDDNESRDLIGGLARGFMWLVGEDVLGGLYAINLGHFNNIEVETMLHWSPANAQWQPLGFTYEQFLTWALSGGLDTYYRESRWPGWETTVAALPLDHGIIDRTPTPMSVIVQRCTAAANPDHPYPMTWSSPE